MPQWGTFAGVTGVVLLLLLVLSHLTTTVLEEVPDTAREGSQPTATSSDPDSNASALEANGSPTETGPAEPGHEAFEGDAPGRDRLPVESLSTAELLANVALSQGLFAGVLIGAALYTGIPAEALGIAFTMEYLVTGITVGVGVGVLLYVANELGAASAKRFGIDHSEELREMLAPDSAGGWIALLAVVLPIIAIFEELLFRAALIGVLSAGFDLSPWILAVGSSIVFGFGHGIQGTAGVVVTGLLGFVLAAVFIYTGSLLVVVVAHYLINALEFVVHEGLDLEWAETGGG
ncbi:CPBP family intramembrane glutamic endopeptidase [Natrialbaceae archaeon A-gly3]